MRRRSFSAETPSALRKWNPQTSSLISPHASVGEVRLPPSGYQSSATVAYGVSVEGGRWARVSSAAEMSVSTAASCDSSRIFLTGSVGADTVVAFRIELVVIAASVA